MANKIYIGDLNVGTVKLGSSDVSIYLGDEKVYPLSFKLQTMINGQKSLSIGCTSGNTTISSAETHPSTAYTLYTSASIGECVDTIGEGAFSGYTSMTGVTIPNTITSIGNYAFQSCLHLSDYSIPSGVTSIGSNAFNSCEHITSITIPDSVTSIGSYAFYSCNRATSLSIGSGLTSIGDNVFYNCTGLTSVNIPDTITSIDDGAFQYCRGLNSINIGNGVTTIGYYAFNTCSSATSISIGSGVTTIKNEAFAGCTALTSITIDATTPPTLGSNVFYNTNDCPIYVPCDSVNTYKAASGWSSYASRITCLNPTFQGKWKATYSDSSVTSAECGSSSEIVGGEIGAYNLVSVEIGDCVTSIGYRAFGGCTSLTNINIPSGVTSIGDNAFGDCTSLTNINIPSGVTSIGESAFDGCTGLTSCTIGSGVTSIGHSAFHRCSSLTSIDIPDSVTSIGHDAFTECRSLTSCTIGDGITYIERNAFFGCTSLTSITVNATTPPTLDTYVFENTNDCPIYVPCESVTTYKAASGWSDYASRITCLNPPTTYTYLVAIRGLEGKDTCDIDWKNIKTDYGVGNGSYTITTTADTVYVTITNYDYNNYSVDYDDITLTSDNPDKKVTFTYQGGGLTFIPQGTDMKQYYYRPITRFKIGDSSLPSGYQTVRITFTTGGQGAIDAWGGVNFKFDNTYVTSLPCDVSGSDTISDWIAFNPSWQSTNENPFNDLWIEFA